MACSRLDLQERLMGLVHREIESGEQDLLSRHVAECSDCRRLASQLREVDALLRGPGRGVLENMHPSPEVLIDFSARSKMLPEGEVRKIEKHLASCPSCSTEVGLVSEAQEVEPSLEDAKAEAQLPAAVRNAIAKTRRQTPQAQLERVGAFIAELARSVLWPKVWLPATAIALVAVSLLIYRSVKPSGIEITALPLMIDDQTLVARHGGRSTEAKQLADQLRDAYPGLLSRLSRSPGTPRILAPEGDPIALPGIGKPAGRKLRGKATEPRSSDQAKKTLTLETRLNVKERGSCSLSIAAVRADGLVVSVREEENVRCSDALAEIEKGLNEIVLALERGTP